jgi:multidrug resistance protein, MATE family
VTSREELKDRPLTEGWLKTEVGPMLRLGGPVVLAELGWMAMGLVDLVMVGRLGAEAIGAVGIGNILYMAICIVGYGLLLGLDPVISQAFGAKRIELCHRALVQGIYLALALSPPLIAVILISAGRLRAWGVDSAVVPAAVAYLGVNAWSLPFLLLHTAFRRYLQGMNVVKPIAVSLIVANLVNVVGNWLLVYGHLGAPALGVVGSAWSTFLARGTMASILAAAVLLQDRKMRTGLLRTSLRPDWPLLRRLLVLGWPASGQLTLEIGVFAVATVLAGRLGVVALAAHEIVLNVCSLTFMVPLGVSAAGTVRVGQALGREDPAAAARAGWTALSLGASFMACSSLVLLLWPRAIFGTFTADAAVLSAGIPLLFLAALFQLFDGLQVISTGLLRGAGDTRTALVVNIAAHWGLGLPVAVLLAFAAGWGVVGLWAGLTTGLVTAGFALVVVWAFRVRAASGWARPLQWEG